VPFAHGAVLLDALGVQAPRLPVECYDLGPRHVYVGVHSREAVANLRPDFAALAAVGDVGVNVFAGEGLEFKTRMFAPAHGVVEDAATGSAAGPLAWHLTRHGVIEFGQAIRIEQGAEIGRPSQLHAVVHGGPGGVEAIEVGGGAVVVAHGEFRL